MRMAPWSSVRASTDPTGSAASAAARSGVSRRRDTPRGGAASSTTPPPATDPGDGRRRAKRSPGAAAIVASRRRIAIEVPSGRSIASRGPRTTSTPDCSVPRCRRRRSRSAGAGSDAGPRRATRSREVWTTSRSVVRTWPRRGGSPSTVPMSSAVRPPAAASTVSPRTWTSLTRTAASPGTSRSVDPARTVPPRRLPVTTVPRPLTVKLRSMASRAPRPSPRRASMPLASDSIAARTSSMPSPVVADAARTGAPASVVAARRASTSAATAAVRAGSTRSAFVTTTRPSRIPIASSSPRCSTVWAFGPSSAATTSSAASISPAPTSMLPTRRSCPGTSTKSTVDPSARDRWA